MDISKLTELEIIEKYSETVRLLAISRTSQISDAEDVYQDVFCSYISHRPKFKDEEHAKAWFIKVTLNITKDMFKAFDKSMRADIGDDTLETVISDEDFINEIEQKTDFEQNIQKLSPENKTLLSLYFDCGYTIKEIAKFLDKKESNIKVSMMRAKRAYRRIVLDGENRNDMKGDGDNE